MKNFSSWMLVMFMGMFWIFRIAVALTSEMNMDFGGFETLNQQMEIILLFVTLICMILVVKRKVVGGLIYLLSYGMYFGVYLFDNAKEIMSAIEGVSNVSIYTNTFVCIIAMILPIAVLLDLLLDKGRKKNPKDGKTDWFYNNENFDRELDERADKNNYRTM